MSMYNRSAVARRPSCTDSLDDRATRRKSTQRGAVAIEFAALFVVFFTLLYAVLAYSVPFFLMLTFKHLSAEAARSAIRVDPALEHDIYSQVISEQVTQVIVDNWLPETWLNGGCPPPDATLPWQSLPPVGSQPSFGHLAIEEITPGRSRYLLHVCIQRRYNNEGNARDRAIIPILEIGSMRIPSLPLVNGEPLLRASSIGRL